MFFVKNMSYFKILEVIKSRSTYKTFILANKIGQEWPHWHPRANRVNWIICYTKRSNQKRYKYSPLIDKCFTEFNEFKRKKSNNYSHIFC